MSQQEEIKEQSVKVFYLNHYDGLSRLTPLLLVEGEKIWQGAIKQRISGGDMYYIFFNSASYIKLWKDSKGNLLYYIGNYYGNLFFAREPQVWQINNFTYDNNSLTYNDVTLKFSVPIFRIAKELNTWLSTPVASVIYKLFF
jgi:hypothetical protein